MLVVAFLICVAAYLVATGYAVHRAGASVQERAGRRSQLFIFAALVCWVPTLIAEFFVSKGVLHFVLRSTARLNGLSNACVYLVQCRLARREFRGQAFDLAPEVLAASPRDVNGSLTVAFSEDLEVVPVSSITASANRTAMQETAALEATHETLEDVLGLAERSADVRAKQLR